MPSADFEFVVTPSVFDRLLEPEAGSARSLSRTGADAVQRLRQAVRRDLENLLNTRDTSDVPPEFVEACQSVLTYGLADFSRFNTQLPLDQERVRHIVERGIRLFEPRLTAVTVTLSSSVVNERTLRMRVDARLLLDPEPVPVSFDVIVPQHSDRCEVKEKG